MLAVAVGAYHNVLHHVPPSRFVQRRASRGHLGGTLRGGLERAAERLAGGHGYESSRRGGSPQSPGTLASSRNGGATRDGRVGLERRDASRFVPSVGHDDGDGPHEVQSGLRRNARRYFGDWLPPARGAHARDRDGARLRLESAQQAALTAEWSGGKAAPHRGDDALRLWASVSKPQRGRQGRDHRRDARVAAPRRDAQRPDGELDRQASRGSARDQTLRLSDAGRVRGVLHARRALRKTPGDGERSEPGRDAAGGEREAP